MSKVDPYVIAWPRKWLNDQETGPAIRYLDRFLHDLYIKTGGGVDLVTNITNSESFETSSSAAQTQDNFDYLEQIEDLLESQEEQDIEDHYYTPVKEWASIAVLGGTYTAIDHDFAEGRNGSIITLDPNAEHGSVIKTKNGDSTRINVTGGAVELRHKGRRDTTFTLNREGTCIIWHKFVFVNGLNTENYWSSS